MVFASLEASVLLVLQSRQHALQAVIAIQLACRALSLAPAVIIARILE
jgi:hypothetical protein